MVTLYCCRWSTLYTCLICALLTLFSTRLNFFIVAALQCTFKAITLCTHPSESKTKQKPSWSESASELYRSSDRGLSAELVQIFADRWCHVVSVTVPYCRNIGLLDRSRYFFLQVAPQLYSRGWVDPVPDPLLLRKCGSAGNRTRASGSVAIRPQRRPPPRQQNSYLKFYKFKISEELTDIRFYFPSLQCCFSSRVLWEFSELWHHHETSVYIVRRFSACSLPVPSFSISFVKRWVFCVPARVLHFRNWWWDFDFIWY
jgi:hypothetical protein